uniref:Uncharacterized protein n=1 Tax=viral metagenome TaxID=1070528 RepID=A0A6M3XWY5_9ZZZZ
MKLLDFVPTWVVLVLSAVLAGAIAWQATGDWLGALIAALASLLGVGLAGAKALSGNGVK